MLSHVKDSKGKNKRKVNLRITNSQNLNTVMNHQQTLNNYVHAQMENDTLYIFQNKATIYDTKREKLDMKYEV